MNIRITNAYENNLKNISLTIPINKITALSGVSGSGKSTVLKNILAAYGAMQTTFAATKTVRDALQISDYIKADKIENMPQTVFIDVKNTVRSPLSTVSTVSGIQEILKNMFEQFGENVCSCCGKVISPELSGYSKYTADIVYDERYDRTAEYITKYGTVFSESFFDNTGKPARSAAKRSLASITFGLKKSSLERLREIKRISDCQIRMITPAHSEGYDPLLFCECSNCHELLPRLNRNRISFNSSFETGGGACRCCGGTGTVTEISGERLIADRNKGILDGGFFFVSDKGIKYTTITEKFIQAAAAHFGIELRSKISEIPENKLDKLLYGSDDIIDFQDRIGGKKELVFPGIAAALCESFRKGKGENVLKQYCETFSCPVCGGAKFDSSLWNYSLFGTSLSQIMSMTLSELREWSSNVRCTEPRALGYLKRLINKTENFDAVSCGHLSLLRSSSTLSGGELQRLRMCSLINSELNGICYLLDEPSSGLHADDIDKLGSLFRRLGEKNTIVIVEHNKRLLEYCDEIIDMGPSGGTDGGRVLFSDALQNISKYDTPTAQLLKNSQYIEPFHKKDRNIINFMHFDNVNCNNLKNFSVDIPKNCFTTICGVSGSGKSTLLNHVVLSQISDDPSNYGFEDVVFLGQNDMSVSFNSTAASLLGITGIIAKYFAKRSGLDSKCFLLNSKTGKCPVCHGTGVFLSLNHEKLGVCTSCGGRRFSDVVLAFEYNGVNIHSVYETPIGELGKVIPDEQFARISEISRLLGVGHIAPSRESSTLSKGELQRLKLVNTMFEKKKNSLYLLDEPSKGMHISDSEKLICAIEQIVDLGNTVIAVEHNAEIIRYSDYVIELGGTGVSGGYLLYSGAPENMRNTPTAKMLDHQICPYVKYNSEKPKSLHIKSDNDEASFAQFKVHHAVQHRELLTNAAAKAKEELFSAAIPGNIFFSRIRSDDIKLSSPIIRLFNFKEKISNDVSLYSVLGIRQWVCSEEYRHYPDKGDLLRYVFNENSPTGKCIRCSGKGAVYSVPQDFFIDNGELSKVCIKFMNNSTPFKAVKKLLNEQYGINLGKKLSEMSDNEYKALFWGFSNLENADDNTTSWKGIIDYFLQYYRYYPDINSAKVFSKKKQQVCPICNGKMLENDYLEYDVWGISYSELVSIPISQLYNKLASMEKQTQFSEEVIRRLKYMTDSCCGSYKLSDSLNSLNSHTAQISCLISLFCNGVSNMCFVLSNSDDLNPNELSVVKELAERLSENNTVVFI